MDDANDTGKQCYSHSGELTMHGKISRVKIYLVTQNF